MRLRTLVLGPVRREGHLLRLRQAQKGDRGGRGPSRVRRDDVAVVPHVGVLVEAAERLRSAPGLPDRGITFPKRWGRPSKSGDSPVTGVSEAPETKAPQRGTLANAAIAPRLYDVRAA